MFNKLFQKIASRVSTKSNSGAVRAAGTAVALAPYWKIILIAGLIISLLFTLGMLGTGFGQGFVSLTQKSAGCVQPPSGTEVQDGLGNEYTLSTEERKDIETSAEGNPCRVQGDGFNGLVYPPSLGIVTTWYGVQDDLHPTGHGGMDIANSCGTPIYAFAGGTVEKVVYGSNEKSTAGNYIYPMGEIIIKINDQYKIRILHTKASDTTVKEGDVVSAGQQIATQWSNGPSTGCHLHIEIFKDGKRDDPNTYFKACGFDYNMQKSFSTADLPAAPVQCGAVGGDTSGGTDKEYAKSQITAIFNITGSSLDSEMSCLTNLWNRESNWRVNAQNNAFDYGSPATPQYQAYGIPQAAPGNKMASEGSDWLTNPQTQIRWGLKYIKGRYSSPCGAWAHSESYNWY